MRGIISITHRLRSRAEFLHSVENEFGFIRMAGRSCCRICMTAEPHVLFCAVSGIQAGAGNDPGFGCTNRRRASGSGHREVPDGSTDTLQVPVDPAIACGAGPLSTPQQPTGAYGARTYAAPSNVNTDTDQFSIRIDQKVGAERTIVWSIQLR